MMRKHKSFALLLVVLLVASFLASISFFVVPVHAASTQMALDGSVAATNSTPSVTLDGSVLKSWISGSTINVTLTTSNCPDVLIADTRTTYTSYVIVSSISSNVTTTTWTKRTNKEQISSTNYQDLEEWYAVWSSSGSINITVTLSGTPTNGTVTAFGICGANTASSSTIFDTNSGFPYIANATTSTANPTVSITSSNPVDFVFGVEASNSTGSPTAGTGFTSIQLAEYMGSDYMRANTTLSSRAVNFTLTAGCYILIADAVMAEGKVLLNLTTSYTNDVIIVGTQTLNKSIYENVSTISSTPALTFTLRKQVDQNYTSNNCQDLEEWYTTWSGSGSLNITVTFTATPASANGTAFGISDANTTTIFDSNSGANPSANSTTSSANPTVSITTSNANDFIFGLETSNSTGIPTTGSSSYTGIQLGEYLGSEYEVVSATQSNVPVNFTLTTGPWCVIAGAIMQASYSLSLKIEDCDNDTAISGAIVTMNNGTNNVVTSSSLGWANYTGVSGSVIINVTYYGYLVNSTASFSVSSNTILYVICNIYDITVKEIETVSSHSAQLCGANVTIYAANGTEIENGTTASKTGQVSFMSLPNATLTFSQYAGSPCTLLIGNVTQSISSDNQSITLTATQNNITVTDSHITYGWKPTG
jgi:metal-sulfur cluster biosynthetic enzyme